MQLQRVYHDTLDFIQVPDFPSAIETRSLPTLTRFYPRRFTFYFAWPAAPFARLTHSRRNVVQREPWLISVSLDEEVYPMNSKITPAQVSPGVL
jgi:hypothetical protein